MPLVFLSEKIAQNDPLLQNECDSERYFRIMLNIYDVCLSQK